MTKREDRLIVGRVVRSLRERAGRTRPEFASACHTSEPHLRNIENGHKRPSTALLQDLELQLGTHGLLTDLASGAPGVRRRIILQSLALMGATIPDDAVEHGSIGAPQLEAVRSMTAAMRDLDNRHGGAHANHSIVAYLQNVAIPMLDTATPSIRTHLFSSVAELALLAGWSAFDAGVQASARIYFARAKEIAEEVENAALAVETVIAESNRAAIAGEPAAAVDAAEAAVDAAEEIDDPALVGEARMALAHGHAIEGDERATAAAIDAAERDFDRADRPDAPEWIGHVGEAWLDGRIAQCLRLVDDRSNAAAAAERTAANARPGPRGNVLNLGHSALVMFAADRPEEGAGYAMRALAASGQIQSARVEEYMRRLEVAAARYDGVPEAAELQDALALR